MLRLVLFIAFSWASVIARGEDIAPQGSNCNLTAPPAESGEEVSHGITLRVYPRASDIGSKYTGCQALFAPNGLEWVVISLTEVIDGDPVRIWSVHKSEDEVNDCRFRKGKVIRGNPEKCPVPEYLLVKSMAPGCADKVRAEIAKNGLGALRPEECEHK
jgi:hypothetical protein